jgi:hypothetical protein
VLSCDVIISDDNILLFYFSWKLHSLGGNLKRIILFTDEKTQAEFTNIGFSESDERKVSVFLIKHLIFYVNILTDVYCLRKLTQRRQLCPAYLSSN